MCNDCRRLLGLKSEPTLPEEAFREAMKKLGITPMASAADFFGGITAPKPLDSLAILKSLRDLQKPLTGGLKAEAAQWEAEANEAIRKHNAQDSTADLKRRLETIERWASRKVKSDLKSALRRFDQEERNVETDSVLASHKERTDKLVDRLYKAEEKAAKELVRSNMLEQRCELLMERTESLEDALKAQGRVLEEVQLTLEKVQLRQENPSKSDEEIEELAAVVIGTPAKPASRPLGDLLAEMGSDGTEPNGDADEAEAEGLSATLYLDPEAEK